VQGSDRAVAAMFRELLNFCLSNFIHLHEMPFVSERGAVVGMLAASQLNSREWLG
jgi:hypothetical protein